MSTRHHAASAILLVLGCVAPSDEAGQAADAPARAASSGAPEAGREQTGVDASTPPVAATPPSSRSEFVDAAASTPESADIRLARSDRFDSYLVDREGRALYMHTGDVAGSGQSACVGECKKAWTPFDVPFLALAREIDRDDIGRFHRQDGSWQTTFRGFPLYYSERERDLHEVSADGTDGKWFVARPYLLFLTTARDLTYLTDGRGRTLYVCLDDQRGSRTTPAVSSCQGECAGERPPWYATATLRTTALPSLLTASDLGTHARPEGAAQLTYRGWPLYYDRNDRAPGDLQGHNQGAWRAIDPVAFSR